MEAQAKYNKDCVGSPQSLQLMNAWSLEAFSCHFMLHLYFAHRATLVPDWAGSFNSSNARGKNRCFDLSCRSCPPSGDRNLEVLAPERGKLETVRPFSGEA